MKKSYLFSLLLACTVFSFLLTGCNSAKEEVIPAITLSPVAQAVYVGEKATITIENTTNEDPTINNVVALDHTSAQTMENLSMTMSNNTITVNATEPAVFDVYIEIDDIKSNTVTVTIQAKPGSTSSENTSESTDSTDTSDQNAAQSDLSVDQAIAQADSLIQSDTVVSITGSLPQSLMELADGRLVPVIWNEDATAYIVLEGETIDFGGCQAVVTGTLHEHDGELTLDVTQAQQLN